MFLYHDMRKMPYLGGDTMYLPAQAIPKSKKNDKWVKECLDSLETIGLRQLSLNRERFEDAYRIVDGSYKYSEVTSTSAFLSEVDHLRAQAELPEEIDHHGFIEPIINTLVGEYLKKPNKSVIWTDDPESTNDFLRYRKNLLVENTMERLKNEIELKMLQSGLDPYKRDFASEEEQQAHIQQIQQFQAQNTPQKVQELSKSNFKPNYVIWAEKIIDESDIRHHLDEKRRQALTDYLITGRYFLHFRMGHDFMEVERWSPINTFTSVTQEEKYPQLGEYVGRIQHLTPNQVITNWGHKLSQKEKQAILRSKNYRPKAMSEPDTISSNSEWMRRLGGVERQVSHPQAIPYENLGYLQELTGQDLGYRGWFPDNDVDLWSLFGDNNTRTDLIRTVEGYWLSYKQIGYLYMEVEGEEGEPVIIDDIVTEDLLTDLIKDYGIKNIRSVSLEQRIADPQLGTIVWDYIPEVWYGVKIGMENTDLTEDLYLDGKPLDYQMHGESDTYHTMMPVAGVVENTSLVSRLEIDQIEYSMAMNMARDYMSKELGVFFLMDLAYLPEFLKDQGGEEAIEKLNDITRNLGLLPLDSTQAKGTAFNNFQSVNMDLTAAMLGKFELAKNIKVRAFEKLGLHPQRMAMPTEQETATGIQVSQDASYAQTEVSFDKFAKGLQRVDEMLINVYQWLQYNGKDVTVNYTDPDGVKQFVRLNDPKLPLRKFRIYPQNNSKRRAELELLKQTYFQDNTIEKSLEDMAEIISSDSTAKIIKIAKLQRQRRELLQQQAMEMENQREEMKQAREDNRQQLEFEHKERMALIKGKIDLNRQAILALGFSEDKDVNKDNEPDIIKQLELSIKQLDSEHQRQLSDRKEKREEVKDIRQSQIDREKLNLEREKVQVERKKVEANRYIADKKLKVAKTNKNRYDK